MILNVDGRGQRIQYVLRNTCNDIDLNQIVQNDNKLVATLPANCVRVTHESLQAFDHRHQNPVAGLVTKTVVDLLEVIPVSYTHLDVYKRQHLLLVVEIGLPKKMLVFL